MLNRKKLLQFIDSQPKQRYTAIGNLFGYDYLDSIEEIFRRKHNELEASLRDKNQDYANSIKSLSNKLDLDFKLRYKNPTKKQKFLNYNDSREQYDLCINELNKRIDGIFPKIEKNTNFEEFFKLFQETLNSDEKKQARAIIESIDKLNELLVNGFEGMGTNENIGSIEYPKSSENRPDLAENKTILNLKQLKTNLNTLLSKYDLYLIDSAKNASLLLNILKTSRDYIIENNSKTCPVCKSNIKPKLTENIKTEISELENNLKSIDNLKRETKTLITHLKELNNDLNFIKKQIEHLDEKEILNIQMENIQKLEKQIKNLELLSDFKISTRDIENPLESINNQLMDIKKHIKSSYLKENNEYEQRLELLSQCLSTLINLEHEKKIINTLENEYKLAKATYDVYRKEKVKYIRKTLEKLTDRINKYYSFIHDNDSINSPKFVVSGSTGLKLRINSFNKESDPREYSSEGHLDTLGLCIFLAFLKENSPVPIIILDDIVATVDLSHKERISRLLLDEFEDYQIILTTHNKTWFNQLKHMTKARERRDRKNSKFQFVEITSWNIDEGPHLSNNKSDEDIIRKHLSENDLVAAVHASRRHLEMVLKNICIANKARMAYKETPYFLTDYLIAAKNAINVLTKESELNEYYNNLFFEIEDLINIGNSFVHSDDEDLTRKEAKDYINTVFQLQDSVTCNKCGYYIKFNIKAKKGECTNKKCHSRFNL